MIEIIQADCLDILPTFPLGEIKLAFLDPPFNQGVAYQTHNDNMAGEEYIQWLKARIHATVKVLAPNGSIWVAISPKWQAECKMILSYIPGLYWVNTVIWHYTFGSNQRTKFTPSYTPMHYYSCSRDDYTFHPPRVPSDRQTKYNDKRAHPDGKVPDDVWEYSRVCGTFNERVNHPCQMPVALLERIVLTCTDENDIVLDSFCGSGTTLVAAAKHNRHGIGIEISDTYCQLARKRVNDGRQESIS